MFLGVLGLVLSFVLHCQAAALCSQLANATFSTVSGGVDLAVDIAAGSNFTGQTAEPVATTNASTAHAEVWLPSNWTGRFMSVGNGGFAGGVNYPDLVWSLRKGFAAMSTDTGHQSTSGNGSWLSVPAAATDWGHRALHISTLAAKEIVELYYGDAAEHSYYAGCSTGGRQGLNAAQRYPEDFDGVLVSSAIPWQTHTAAWQTYVALQQYPQNGSNPAFIPASLWPVIAAAVLQQCDSIDGVKDNIIMNPARCNFQPEVLLCGQPGTNSTSCMNGAQIENLKRMYRPWLTDAGELINPGISYSGEASFSFIMNQPVPQFGPIFYGYAVVNDSAWDWSTIPPATVTLADEINPGGANAVDPAAMTAFQGRGGKVIHYHGYSDPLIPVYNAALWYDQLVAYYSDAGRGGQVEDFYRLFTIPGMGHCSGGPGAWVVDGAGQGGVLPASTDADHSMIWSLVEWVEGTAPAPESVVGTKFVGDSPSSGIAFERPVCRWPGVAEYLGGNATSVDSWACSDAAVYY
ncbi:putative feruloyl esterase B-2 [Cyphellophora attinorum]|uniref:Carboxylic ester hydrolase n=1 Tax=Cyphellophora attinorum TaxID=1664694 RepID=A0A0N1H6D7_9EURO|nr:putative feruloyl esterase B-2 [Phialophora attinorum]KPI38253.1 putative feruloyl esterase B-2 [Phialophora attinorum]